MAVGWVRRRRQARAKIAQWEREDAELEAARLAAEDASHEPLAAGAPEGVVAARSPQVPMVEHDGNWYTLH